MTHERVTFHRLGSGRVRVTLAGVLFVAVSACGQSPPGIFCSPRDERAWLALVGSVIPGADREAEQTAAGVGAAGSLIQELRSESFRELTNVDLRVRAFHSQADYFRTRFSISRFLFMARMRYFVDVNPALLQQRAPSDGVCAILAHELVHVVSLNRGNRIRRFGLVRLLSKRQTAKFERRADLETIHRGYGDGLESYRRWVYTHIPPRKLEEKLRNYFSPEEIATIEKMLQAQPDLFAYWSRHVPANLQEIERGNK